MYCSLLNSLQSTSDALKSLTLPMSGLPRTPMLPGEVGIPTYLHSLVSSWDILPLLCCHGAIFSCFPSCCADSSLCFLCLFCQNFKKGGMLQSPFFYSALFFLYSHSVSSVCWWHRLVSSALASHLSCRLTLSACDLSLYNLKPEMRYITTKHHLVTDFTSRPLSSPLGLPHLGDWHHCPLAVQAIPLPTL